MHIPGHILDPATAIATGIVSLSATSDAGRRLRTHWLEKLPAMGAGAGLIFAAQMWNFPVASGTSGHLLGAAFAGIVLGPAAGILTVASVLIIQCAFLHDGGVDALGANIFNMAFVGAGGGYAIYHSLARHKPTLAIRAGSATVAAALSVILAAGLCSIELSMSGDFSLMPTLTAMLIAHAPIAILEGLATGLGLFILTWSYEPSFDTRAENQLFVTVRRNWITTALLMTLGLLILSAYSSSLPDGLQATLTKVATAPGP